MVEEVLDILPAPGGEVVDDDDVVVLCQCLCKVRADEAGAAGDDVAHEESMLMPWFSSFLTVLLKEQSGMIGGTRDASRKRALYRSIKT